MNEVADTTLAQFWSNYLRRGATALSLLPASPYANLALGKPADQSSVSQWSTAGDRKKDAAGAVSGKLTGGYQFHTGLEDSPWWMVDLEAPALVHEIRVFNRMENAAMAARLRGLAVELSDDGARWRCIATKPADQLVGGVQIRRRLNGNGR
jgi:hypothetical protein